MINKYNLGDEVWYASFEIRTKQIVCDDCRGQKYLTVIMGDGSQVTIDCVGCSAGFEPPKGYNTIYEGTPNSELKTITKVEIEVDRVRYQFSHYICDEDRLFDTKEEADKEAERLAEEYKQEQLYRLKNLKENNKRTWSWNAYYHRRAIKQAQKDLEYHTAKLEVAKIKEKELAQKNMERRDDPKTTD